MAHGPYASCQASSSAVRAKILELHQSISGAARQEADAALRAFAETDPAWLTSKEFLADPEPTVQFFGAQTLRRKLQDAAQGYHESRLCDLKDWAAFLLQQAESTVLQATSKQQLVIALASIAVALCNTSWNTAVQDLLMLAERQPKIAWGTLLIIPEQLSNTVHKYLKADAKTLALLGSSGALLAAAARYPATGKDEAPTGTLADSEFSLALQTVSQWSKVMGLQILEHEAFSTYLVGLIGSPAVNSDVVLDTVLEVLRRSNGAFLIYEPAQSAAPGLQRTLVAVTRSMQNMLPSLEQRAANPSQLDDDDARRLARWAEVAGNLIEAYTQLLWLDQDVSEILLRFIGACLMVHSRVAQAVSELWAVLKDAKRDGKLPEGVMPRILQRLVEPSICSFMRFSRFDVQEDRADLVHMRSAQLDILVDMYCVAAGTPEAQFVLATLLKRMDQAESAGDVLGLEVVWYAFQGIAEVIADEPNVPDAYHVVLRSVVKVVAAPAEVSSTGAALLRACGPHYEHHLQAHLPPAVQWLMTRVEQIPVEASETIQELCGYAGKLLLPFVEEFLKAVVKVAPAAPSEVDAALHGALVGIARNLPADQLPMGFAQVCQGSAESLKTGIDTSSDAGRMMLHRILCRLLRCDSVMEQAGSSQQGIGPTPEARTASSCLASFLLSCWTSLAPPCQQILLAAPVGKDAAKGRPIFEYSDVALQVNVLALLRRAGRAACEAESADLAQQLQQMLVSCCQEGQLAVLAAMAQMAESPPLAQNYVLPQLELVSKTVLMHLQKGGPAEDLIPFLDLCSSLAGSVGDTLFASQHLAPLSQLCIAALQSTEHEVLKPVLLFLQRLLTQRTLALSDGDVSALAQQVVGRFQQWPRSMSGQIFKVFSAMAESAMAMQILGYTRLLDDLQSIQFSQPIERSALNGSIASKLGGKREDPLKPGFSTAHFIGGTVGTNKRADPFFLAERYEIQCDCELMAELLRFIYCGEMSFFQGEAHNDKANEILTQKMLAICFEAERFSVDALYEKLLSWFGRRSFYVVGELNFADAFYHLQHYEHRATEEHSRNVLVQTIASDMVSSRDQFRAVTRDSRWCSLPVYFVETILNYDKLPIVSETEILSLIERWNATADKDKSDIVRLLACFRPSEDSKMAMKNWLCLMGWVDDSGNVVSIPGLEGLEKIISGKATKGKKPRNCKSADVDVRDYTKAMLENYHSDLQPEGNEDEIDATFFHYHGSKVLAQGCSFNLGAGDRLLQADVLRDSGISRLRVALSEPSSLLWNPEHEVFVGLSYGEGKYFGFLCSASAFSGIFSVRALASAAPAPSAPVHLTGSGNKMEFDLGLEIQLHRVDLVVTCELSCIFKNEYLTKERFQISHDTLVNGPGLRYQLVGTGLEKSRVLVNLAWVSGGGPSNDKHVDYGPIGFVEGEY
ncbi:unnamed protein product [Durusdinium trenchii]|uniref:Uncharacterized protein n=1 Tax=Durusdinium trenchii TaxID=1381693 RepID=A0ABP0L357_9DINO